MNPSIPKTNLSPETRPSASNPSPQQCESTNQEAKSSYQVITLQMNNSLHLSNPLKSTCCASYISNSPVLAGISPPYPLPTFLDQFQSLPCASISCANSKNPRIHNFSNNSYMDTQNTYRFHLHTFQHGLFSSASFFSAIYQKLNLINLCSKYFKIKPSNQNYCYFNNSNWFLIQSTGIHISVLLRHLNRNLFATYLVIITSIKKSEKKRYYLLPRYITRFASFIVAGEYQTQSLAPYSSEKCFATLFHIKRFAHILDALLK